MIDPTLADFASFVMGYYIPALLGCVFALALASAVKVRLPSVVFVVSFMPGLNIGIFVVVAVIIMTELVDRVRE